MNRRNFLKYATGSAAALRMLRFEAVSVAQSKSGQRGGRVIDGLYPANIVQLRDGSLLTDKWDRSTDGGMTWTKMKTFFQHKDVTGLIRLPNQMLGYYYAEGLTDEASFGNGSDDWYFCCSSDEGLHWSSPTKITLPGLTMGLQGTMFTLRSGRLILVTYSQFIPRMALWGGSWGTYKGIRVKTESEGHFAEMEAVRVYYSDDNGQTWKPNDAWIIGWHGKKYTDSFVEATGVELRDGRVLIMGRSLTGRLYQATSEDQGKSWSYATPTELVSSDSPPFLTKFPQTADLLIVWNQISREENRKGFRRSRLESAISRDDGRTWVYFKTIEHGGVPAIAQIPPSPDLSPVWGDDDVGELPDDYGLFHYPSVNIVGDDVYVSYSMHHFSLGKDQEGIPRVLWNEGKRTRVLPTKWFYT